MLDLEYPGKVLKPQSPEELAEILGGAGSRGQRVALAGAGTKRLMAGPVEDAEVVVSTSALSRVLQYEPQDLTISVEAGLSWCELTRVLAANRQMIPLDPPFGDAATVGGVVAANTCGARRRLYGTARDMIIGMKFATLEGKLAQSGGMVVKNVAGLDMAKLMVGSFGTLAAIAVVNFKLAPQPAQERSFALSCGSLEEAITARNEVLRSVLQPAAIDLLNPAAWWRPASHLLVIQAGGNDAVLERYRRELERFGPVETFNASQEGALWSHIRNFTPRWLSSHAGGAVVRVSSTLQEMRAVLEALPGPAVARAGAGICYGYFEAAEPAAAWTANAARRGWQAVVEFAPEAAKPGLDLWPAPGNDFAVMQRVKQLFDPKGLLNRGRMYGRF